MIVKIINIKIIFVVLGFIFMLVSFYILGHVTTVQPRIAYHKSEVPVTRPLSKLQHMISSTTIKPNETSTQFRARMKKRMEKRRKYLRNKCESLGKYYLKVSVNRIFRLIF